MASISAPILGTTSRIPQSRLQKLTRKIFDGHTEYCLHQGTPPGPKARDSVTVVCISDTHNKIPDLPPGDILLHAGDLSQYGTYEELRDHLAWLRSLPHQHKIVVAGNHDLLLDEEFVKSHPDRQLDRRESSKSDLNWGDVVYLEDDLVSIEVRGRKLNIFGSPYTGYCGSFAFQYDQREDIWKSKIPSDADIVLVHGPPAVYLDDGKGCEFLLSALHDVKPRLAVFGHIHLARGRKVLSHDRAQLVYEDIILGRRRWLGLGQLLFHRVSGLRNNGAGTTTLVNAAVFTSTCGQEVYGGVTVEL